MAKQNKKGLLFLCHRLPYPPNKGDKIRSWHLLKFLARHYRVYLGTFVDDPDDWQHAPVLESLCEEVKLVKLTGMAPKVRAAMGLVLGQSASIPWYRDSAMKEWVEQLVNDQRVDLAIAYSSPTAQYVLRYPRLAANGVIDLVDIDSDKWAQYAQKKSWPVSLLYRIEARRLFTAEAMITRQFKQSFFVSSTEAEHFRQMLPQYADKIAFFNNGVDTDYFIPGDYPSPFNDSTPTLVFTGAMDYWPNVDAVTWFANEVFPVLRDQCDVRFCIVGSKPGKEVQALANMPGIVVTGRVPDVRPYLAHAKMVVAPMRVARGVQNKVLEGLAMDRIVLTTSLGLEGISALPEKEVLVADTAQQWQQQLLDVLKNDKCIESGRARQRVLADFNWDNTLPVVLNALEGASSGE